MYLAVPLLLSGEIEDLKLGTVCRHYGIDDSKLHTALEDVKCTLQLARCLVRDFTDSKNMRDALLCISNSKGESRTAAFRCREMAREALGQQMTHLPW
jgi:DNA polymerase III epsilon subunit-like protein